MLSSMVTRAGSLSEREVPSYYVESNKSVELSPELAHIKAVLITGLPACVLNHWATECDLLALLCTDQHLCIQIA